MNQILRNITQGLLTTTCVALAGMWSNSAQAAILSVSSQGKIIAAPASVADNAPGIGHNNFMLGFDEQQNILLNNNLQVDGGFIAAGTKVSSHMILLNHSNSSESLFSRSADWTFDGVVIGVMSDPTGTLEVASSGFLGASNTIYPTSPFHARGMESKDNYSGVGTNMLSVSLHTTQPGDWIRVITVAKAVPEASSIWGIITIGAIGTTSLLKRKKLATSKVKVS